MISTTIYKYKKQTQRLAIVLLLTGCAEQCECGQFTPPPIPFPVGFEPPVAQCPPPPDDDCSSKDKEGGSKFYHPAGSPEGCCIPTPVVSSGDNPTYVLPVFISDPDDPNGCPLEIGTCFASSTNGWACVEFPSISGSSSNANETTITYGPKQNQIGSCDPKTANCNPM